VKHERQVEGSRFNDLALIVGDDFDALEVDAEGEAVLCEPGGVGVYCLGWKSISSLEHSQNLY
jgi:hypothetical protein